MKWTGLTGVFGSLLSAGGLFGISRMAMNVAANRQNVLGLGTTYGGRESFLTNFERIGNPEGILDAVNQALHGANNAVPLATILGHAPQSSDPVKVAMELLPRVQQILKRSNPSTMDQTIKAYQMGGVGIDIQTAQILQNMSPEELRDMIRNHKSLSGRVDVDPATQLVLQNLVSSLDRAGDYLNTEFARLFGNLTPGIESLASAFSNVFENMLKAAGPLEKWLAKGERGLDKFSKYLDTGEFDKDAASVLKTAKEFGQLVMKILGGSASPDAGLNGEIPKSPGQRKVNRYVNWLLRTGGGVAVGGAKAAVGAANYIAGGGAARDTRHWLFGPSSRGQAQPSGVVDPGLRDIEAATEGLPGGSRRITAENDAMHHRLPYRSQHARGLAFDRTLINPRMHAEAAAAMRREMEAAGLGHRDYKVIDEYAHPSPYSTGPHIHTQFNSPEAASIYHKWYQEQHPQLQGAGKNTATVHVDNDDSHVETKIAPYGAMPQGLIWSAPH